MKYKVIIPSAGIGSRLNVHTKGLNKALVSVNNKPMISHVIEKFPRDVEIVIALGYDAENLKDYLGLAHGDRELTFVEVNPFVGVGSGLGYSILQCKDHLQCPFVFCTNDTLVLDSIPPPTADWVGYSNENVATEGYYRKVQFNKNGILEKLREKDEVLLSNTKPYIGLCGIRSYKEFWQEMENGLNYGSIERGESYAIERFAKNKKAVLTKGFSWFDVGNVEQLRKTREAIKTDSTPDILEKEDECIWFVSDRVIKYNTDPDFIKNRVKRSKMLRNFVPRILEQRKNMYCYEYISGEVFSKRNTPPNFSNLLQYLDRLWERKKLNQQEAEKFRQVCDDFYRQKTQKRLNLFLNRMSISEKVETINGIETPPASALLFEVDWGSICSGIPSRIHGDLHFENILVRETGDFCLIDWRQDFGGMMEFGDIYYDLAKLLHGIIVSHDMITANHFYVNEEENVVSFDLHRKHSSIKLEHMFYDYLEKNGYDKKKTIIMTALIFLNIAPLHHYPYNKMLFYLGRSMLYDAL